MLDEVIETKDFTTPMTLKDAVTLLYEKFAAKGKDFNLLVDVDAFRRVDPDCASPYEAMVQLPPVPKQMTMHLAMRVLLSQMPMKTIYLVRQGHIVILPPERATAQILLQERVFARADKATLREVLDDLAASTGLPIIVDARVKEKAQERVTVMLDNMSLEDCLTALTAQAGLRFVTLDSGIFVTAPEDAKNLEERRKKRTPPPVRPEVAY